MVTSADDGTIKDVSNQRRSKPSIPSSDSDDEDDAQMRQFIEAADTTLLTNAMFQKPLVDKDEQEMEDTRTEEQTRSTINLEKVARKSQRYLPEDELEEGIDFSATESMRCHISKKLTALIQQRIEFCNIHPFSSGTPKHKKIKSRVKLLHGMDCFVKPYEEFEFETKGPEKKPLIKRRKIDPQEPEFSEEERLNMSAVNSQDITTGKLLAGWAKKADKPHKVFHYRKNKSNVLHAIEPESVTFSAKKKSIT